MNIKNFKISAYSSIVVTIIVTAQSIALAPIYIKEIGTSMYGAWMILSDFLVALQFFDFGITAYSAQKIAKARAEGDSERQQAYFYSSLCITVVSLTCMTSLIWLGVQYLHFPKELTLNERGIIVNCVYIGAIAVSIQLISHCFTAFLRATEDLAILSVTSVIGAALGFATAAEFLKMNYGIYAAPSAILVRNFIVGLGGLISIYTRKNILRIKLLNYSTFKITLLDQLKNAPITATGNISALAISSCDNFLIGRVCGLEDVTRYSVSKKLFDFIRTVIDLYAYSAYGGIATTVSPKSREGRYLYLRRHYKVMILGLLSMCLVACSVNRDFVRLWVGGDLFFGENINLLLMLGIFLSSISNFTFGVIRAAGRFDAATKYSIFELALKVTVAYLLMVHFGLIGMALGILVSAFITLVMECKIFEIPLLIERRREEFKIIILVVLAIIGNYASNSIIRYTVDAIIFLACYYLLKIAYEELGRIKND